MIHYFYGIAANPFTLAHEKIVRDLLKDPMTKLYLGITDHNYKSFDYSYDLRKRIVEENLKDLTDRIVILRQDQRTYAFLSSLHDMMDFIVVGEDEWNDLNAGKWHYSTELLNTWSWKVIPRNDGISSSKVREMLKNGANFNDLKTFISEKTYNILKEE